MGPDVAADLTGPWLFAWLLPIIVLDGFLPPVPSEIALITAGTIAAEGRANPILLVAVAAVGSWLSDLGVYLVFRRRLTGLLDRTGWGRRTHRTIHDAVERFGKSSTYGAIIGARFLPGGRLATSATAGIAEVSPRGFAASTAVGGVLWAAWHVGLGFVTGHATGLPFWASGAIGAGIGLTVGLCIAAVAAARHRRRRDSGRPLGSEAAE
ncbi:DedA family protein [Sinomonas mesophila]|uniref:DedA family protein n=1 Tax=Sinomonas mesophila TaxID=1531955 RepID=UPI000984A93E|nr:VTT domain-containing protein [Sinomonas mesophila]